MKFLTKPLHRKLLANGQKPDQDHAPVVKFFNPCGAATWLISELDMDNDTAFGLCDLGMGCPELGNVSLKELQSIRGPLGLGIERDRHFKTDRPMSEFAEKAYAAGRIVA